MTDVLIASVPIHGHVAPLLAAAAGLVDRGHRVRFLTGARFAVAVQATGSRFIALPDGADFDDRTVNAGVDESMRPPGIGGLRYDVARTFLAPARAQYDALLALTEEPTDVVLVDPTFLGAGLLAATPRERRPPVIVGGVLPLTLSSAYVPPFGLALKPLRNPAGRLDRVRNRLLRLLVERVVFGPVQREYDALNRSVTGRPARDFIVSWLSAVDAIVQFSVPSFEYPRPDAPVPIRFAGPIIRPLDGDLPVWWSDLETARTVVLVTQGTIANHDLGELVRPTIEALADSDALVVVTTGGPPVADLGRLPANVRAEEYLPYDRLFPLLSVAVTNGGYGGVHYALSHGVPLVVAGAGEDKPEVAARVEWSGVGINLRTGRPTPAAVHNAVRQVLAEPGYRTAAQSAAEEIAEAGGVGELLAVMTEIARSGAA